MIFFLIGRDSHFFDNMRDRVNKIDRNKKLQEQLNEHKDEGLYAHYKHELQEELEKDDYELDLVRRELDLAKTYKNCKK